MSWTSGAIAGGCLDSRSFRSKMNKRNVLTPSWRLLNRRPCGPDFGSYAVLNISIIRARISRVSTGFLALNSPENDETFCRGVHLTAHGLSPSCVPPAASPAEVVPHLFGEV